MDYQQIVNLIGQVGFPVLVSLYLIVRLDGTLKQILQSLQQLVDAIQKNGKQQ